MKRMGSDKAYTAGAEGMDYGPGSFRAAVTPQFRTAAEVKAARGRVTTKENFDPIRDAFETAYGSIRDDVKQYAKNNNVRYDTSDAMIELGRGGSANWFGNV